MLNKFNFYLSLFIISIFSKITFCIVDINFSKITNLSKHPKSTNEINYQENFFVANKNQINKLNEKSRHVTCMLLYRNFVAKPSGRIEINDVLYKVLKELRYYEGESQNFDSIKKSMYNLLQDYVIRECKIRINPNSIYEKLNSKSYSILTSDEYDFISSLVNSYHADTKDIVQSHPEYRTFHLDREDL